MIEYIKYTLDGKTYTLNPDNSGKWSKQVNAPSVAGNYSLVIEIKMDGAIYKIDSTNSQYNYYLNVINSTEKVTHLQDLVPDFISNLDKFNSLYNIENDIFDQLNYNIEAVKSNVYLTTSSNEAIQRWERFLKIKGEGTLEQRRKYLKSLLQKSNKLSEVTIKDIVKAITGSNCVVTFFTSDDPLNPEPGYALLRVQVQSPETDGEYRYEDIARTLKPLVPTHLKLSVVKFFATWEDISLNHDNWNSVASMSNWKAIRAYIPPQ